MERQIATSDAGAGINHATDREVAGGRTKGRTKGKINMGKATIDGNRHGMRLISDEADLGVDDHKLNGRGACRSS